MTIGHRMIVTVILYIILIYFILYDYKNSGFIFQNCENTEDNYQVTI